MNTAEQVRKAYRGALSQVGETISIRRYSGGGAGRTNVEAYALAHVANYAPERVVGTIQEGDREIILLADDIETQSAIALPIRSGDKAIVRGKELNIQAVDDNTRRVSGVLVAYVLQVRG